MDIGQRVKTLDGSLGVIISIHDGVARVCYLAPNNRLSFITGCHFLHFLKAAPAERRIIH